MLLPMLSVIGGTEAINCNTALGSSLAVFSIGVCVAEPCEAREDDAGGVTLPIFIKTPISTVHR